MERRLFVKRLSVLTTGTLVLSGSNIYALETNTTTNTIDFTPFSLVDNKITLKGNFIDSETFEPINSVKLIAKIKKNRFFPLNQSLESTDGSYSIASGFNISDTKVNEKISIQIEAAGYKPYKNTIYLCAKGCYIHSEEWNYNPNFKSAFIPKNNRFEKETISSFNFHLVKI